MVCRCHHYSSHLENIHSIIAGDVWRHSKFQSGGGMCSWVLKEVIVDSRISFFWTTLSQISDYTFYFQATWPGSLFLDRTSHVLNSRLWKISDFPIKTSNERNCGPLTLLDINVRRRFWWVGHGGSWMNQSTRCPSWRLHGWLCPHR